MPTEDASFCDAVSTDVCLHRVSIQNAFYHFVQKTPRHRHHAHASNCIVVGVVLHCICIFLQLHVNFLLCLIALRFIRDQLHIAFPEKAEVATAFTSKKHARSLLNAIHHSSLWIIINIHYKIPTPHRKVAISRQLLRLESRCLSLFSSNSFFCSFSELLVRFRKRVLSVATRFDLFFFYLHIGRQNFVLELFQTRQKRQQLSIDTLESFPKMTGSRRSKFLRMWKLSISNGTRLGIAFVDAIDP